jgi:hypothetical protein
MESKQLDQPNHLQALLIFVKFIVISASLISNAYNDTVCSVYQTN